jgi:hypothetical protein
MTIIALTLSGMVAIARPLSWIYGHLPPFAPSSTQFDHRQSSILSLMRMTARSGGVKGAFEK